MATGMLILALRAPAPDALAMLRGYAYVAGRTVDDVAILLLERRLRPEPLREVPDLQVHVRAAVVQRG